MLTIGQDITAFALDLAIVIVTNACK